MAKKLNVHYEESQGLHLNYSIIVDIVEEKSKVLDLGCGSGDLLKMLIDKKNVQARGVEIDQDEVVSSIEKGLSVFQGDIDEGLKEYSDSSYDYVVLNQTLQSTQRPDYVIKEMLRVGKKAVISFPNFAYWRIRSQLFFNGYMPKSNVLPFSWYDTPNIHLLTIKDFKEFAKKKDIKILKEVFTTRADVKKGIFHKLFSNLMAEEVIYVVSRD